MGTLKTCVAALFLITLHICTPVKTLLAQSDRKYGGTFHLNENEEPRSFDPPQINDLASTHISENIYDKLLALDRNLNLIPSLSSLPELSSNGRTYTFHLRTDVRFHDDPCFPKSKGRRFVASDVVYCWTRALDPRSNSLAIPYFHYIDGATDYFENGGTLKKGVTGLAAPNDSTFVVTLTKPFSPFSTLATIPNAFIYPHEAVEHYGEGFALHPVGTGAFQFVEYEVGVHCILRRNPHYWQRDSIGNRMPYLDTLSFTFINDLVPEIRAFEEGRLDHLSRFQNMRSREFFDTNKNLKGKWKQYQLMRVPALSTQFYGFTTTMQGVSNTHLRRAFSFAINREQLIEQAMHNLVASRASHGIVPPCMAGYHSENVRGYSYNPDSAKREFQAAKEEMKTLPALTLYLNTGGGRTQQVADSIRSQLKACLGVDLKLQTLEWRELAPQIDDGKAELFRFGWIADYPSPHSFLSLFYGASVPESGPSSMNSTRYKSATFDSLYEAAIKEVDPKKEMQLWAEAEGVAMRDAPMIVLWYDEDYHMLTSKVRDFRVTAMDGREMKYCWFAE